MMPGDPIPPTCPHCGHNNSIDFNMFWYRQPIQPNRLKYEDIMDSIRAAAYEGYTLCKEKYSEKSSVILNVEERDLLERVVVERFTYMMRNKEV